MTGQAKLLRSRAQGEMVEVARTISNGVSGVIEAIEQVFVE